MPVHSSEADDLHLVEEVRITCPRPLDQPRLETEIAAITRPHSDQCQRDTPGDLSALTLEKDRDAATATMNAAPTLVSISGLAGRNPPPAAPRLGPTH